MKKVVLLLFVGMLSFSLFAKAKGNQEVKVVSTQSELDAVLNNNAAVSVKFMASWCSACNNMKGLDQKMRNQFKDQVVFVEINSDTSKELVDAYKINGIPTYFFFKEGKEVQRVSGAIKEKVYAEYINSIVKK